MQSHFSGVLNLLLWKEIFKDLCRWQSTDIRKVRNSAHICGDKILKRQRGITGVAEYLYFYLKFIDNYYKIFAVLWRILTTPRSCFNSFPRAPIWRNKNISLIARVVSLPRRRRFLFFQKFHRHAFEFQFLGKRRISELFILNTVPSALVINKRNLGKSTLLSLRLAFVLSFSFIERTQLKEESGR